MYYNWGMLVLEIGPALFYYKLGQTFLQIGTASILQIGASVVTNWDSYYKLGQPLSQMGASITIWAKLYYKMGQVFQVRAIITNWGITYLSHVTKGMGIGVLFILHQMSEGTVFPKKERNW